jgi:capsule polysaccharide export protein KpsE/RkpR
MKHTNLYHEFFSEDAGPNWVKEIVLTIIVVAMLYGIIVLISA